MLKGEFVILNGALVTAGQAVLDYRDLAVLRGYGVFDFFRIRRFEPVFLDDHLDRFFASASGLHLTIPYSQTELKGFIQQLVLKNNIPDCGIRLTLTGGISADGFTPGEPGLLISAHSFKEPTEEQRTRGIRLMTYPHQRQLPHIKSIDYLMAIWLQPRLQKKGADDILYHHNGMITESPRSNFFLVHTNGSILTPSANILKGITRSKVLLLSTIPPVIETDISMEDLTHASAAFITSTTKSVLAVSQIDDHIFTDTNRTVASVYKAFTQAYGY